MVSATFHRTPIYLFIIHNLTKIHKNTGLPIISYMKCQGPIQICFQATGTSVAYVYFSLILRPTSLYIYPSQPISSNIKVER